MDSRDGKHSYEYRRLIHGMTSALMGLTALAAIDSGGVEAGTLLAQMQINPMRQDSINKMPSAPDIPRAPIAAADPASSGAVAQNQAEVPPANGVIEASYDPAGRRDPFTPIIQDLQPGKVDESLPPLQRVSLTELNLIAIMWGTYGYTAMVQTSEGHGYTVRQGTKVGQNNGVVSAVTERGIVVQERFTDVYGKKQEREFIKLLHPKEGSE